MLGYINILVPFTHSLKGRCFFTRTRLCNNFYINPLPEWCHKRSSESVCLLGPTSWWETLSLSRHFLRSYTEVKQVDAVCGHGPITFSLETKSGLMLHTWFSDIAVSILWEDMTFLRGTVCLKWKRQLCAREITNLNVTWRGETIKKYNRINAVLYLW